MTEFIYDKKKLVGIKVNDHVTGNILDVHAAQIVNATGPGLMTYDKKIK